MGGCIPHCLREEFERSLVRLWDQRYRLVWVEKLSFLSIWWRSKVTCVPWCTHTSNTQKLKHNNLDKPLSVSINIIYAFAVGGFWKLSARPFHSQFLSERNPFHSWSTGTQRWQCTSNDFNEELAWVVDVSRWGAFFMQTLYQLHVAIWSGHNNSYPASIP